MRHQPTHQPGSCRLCVHAGCGWCPTTGRCEGRLAEGIWWLHGCTTILGLVSYCRDHGDSIQFQSCGQWLPGPSAQCRVAAQWQWQIMSTTVKPLLLDAIFKPSWHVMAIMVIPEMAKLLSRAAHQNQRCQGRAQRRAEHSRTAVAVTSCARHFFQSIY